MDLVEKIYLLTQDFPKEEVYGLRSQMRRATVSIPSNIAEGSRRKTNGERTQFMSIAFGSGAELETQLEITRRLKYGQPDVREEALILLTEVMRMLHVYLRNRQ
jgi:four helix bundle protein